MKIEKIAEKMVYSDKSITKRVLFQEERVLNFVLNLRPGQSVPPHNHEHSDLLVYVVMGQGELTADEKTVEVAHGDVIHCDGKEMFSLKNTGDMDMSCFIVLAPNPSAIYSKEI
ncbi:MAG: cupin domain-containing protein [Bacillota bacterium]|nr:cupin domain-containing protein [Bacillota bacterium]